MLKNVTDSSPPIPEGTVQSRARTTPFSTWLERYFRAPPHPIASRTEQRDHRAYLAAAGRATDGPLGDALRRFAANRLCRRRSAGTDPEYVGQTRTLAYPCDLRRVMRQRPLPQRAVVTVIAGSFRARRRRMCSRPSRRRRLIQSFRCGLRSGAANPLYPRCDPMSWLLSRAGSTRTIRACRWCPIWS